MTGLNNSVTLLRLVKSKRERKRGMDRVIFHSFLYRFTKQDAFVGYHDDTPSSVIFQATEQLHESQSWRKSEDSFRWNEYHNTNEWKRDVLICSKKLLLQMASPDALIRLHNTTLSLDQEKLKKIYFYEQHHGSIVQFLQHHFYDGQSHQSGLLIQVSKH